MLCKFRLSNIGADFHLYKQAQKEFKQNSKHKKQLYQKDRRQETNQAWEVPRRFWQIIKDRISPKDLQIKDSEWHEYFSYLLYCDNAPDMSSIDGSEFETQKWLCVRS